MIWSGYSKYYGGWGGKSILVFNWDSKEWFLDSKRSRYGNDEEWPTSTPINSKYFSDLNCINSRWSDCISSGKKALGTNIQIIEGISDNTACANQCSLNSQCKVK